MTQLPEQLSIRSPTLHVTVFLSIALFAAVIALSFILRIEVIARGQGRIVPRCRVQVVQPEFPGRITAIHVRNGTEIARGDPLIAFDQTEAHAQLNTISAEQDRLRIENARISAMVAALLRDHTGSDFVFATIEAFDTLSPLEVHPYYLEQRDLLQAELADFLAAMEQIAAREEANLRSEAVTNASIARIEAALEIQSERLEAAQALLDQGTTSRSAFLNVQQAFTDLERERDVYLRQLDQKASERSALEAERRRLIADSRSTLLSRRVQINARLATLAEEERTATRRVASAILYSPFSGIIDQLQVFTIGGIVQTGEELLRVVPLGTEIELEAIFSNQDIGFINIGQRANIRIDAYPSERFGFVIGEVVDLAADSTEVTEGQWGYVVRVVPNTA